MIVIILFLSIVINVILIINYLKTNDGKLLAEKSKLEKENEILKNENAKIYEENLKLRDENNKFSINNGILEEKIKQESIKNEDYYKSLKENMVANFKDISHEIIKQQKSDFEEQQINTLRPFREQITEFKSRIEEINKTNIANKASLEQQIKDLEENNHKLQQEARDLTTALKGDKKRQGNWGDARNASCRRGRRCPRPCRCPDRWSASARRDP